MYAMASNQKSEDIVSRRNDGDASRASRPGDTIFSVRLKYSRQHAAPPAIVKSIWKGPTIQIFAKDEGRHHLGH